MENELHDNSSNGNTMEVAEAEEGKTVGDIAALKKRLDYLEKREQELIKEKQDMEVEYGLKRAKLKDLYLQKEDELEKERATSSTMRTNKADLEGENLHLIQELNEYKSQVAIAWESLDNIESEKNKCEEKLASLEQILEETVNESLHNTTKYEKEIARLRKINEKLEAEIDLKNQAAGDKEGVLSVMTKTLAKRVVSLNAHSQSNENIHENLEDSMKKAQEDAEMLRSVVVPLEEEIKALKDKLRATDEQLQAHNSAYPESVAELLKGRTPAEVLSELDEKLKDVNEELKAEKSSRSDLEMYVAVLQTQKTVLQEDTDKLRKELQEVCHLLENEKREYNDLKQTWQMANDQFLEVQRLQIMDMRRMQSLLTMEQQRILSEMQKRDEERMEQEKRVQRFFEIREEQEKRKQTESSKAPASPILSKLYLRRRKSPSPSRGDIPDGPGLDTPLSLKDFLNLERPKSEPCIPNETNIVTDSVNPPVSDDGIKNETQNLSTQSSEEVVEKSEVEEVTLQDLAIIRKTEDNNSELEMKIGDYISNLTAAQIKALEDRTPEQEARKQLLESARARPESLSITSGKRLVSEKEWQLLQEELKKARDKLSRNCDMCSNYEAQLQKVQEHEKEVEKEMQNLEKLLSDCKSELAKEEELKKETEEKALKLSEEARKEISTLLARVEELEKMHQDLSRSYKSCYTDITSQLKLLSNDREKVQNELMRLQQENDSLIGKHSAHSHQMQNEKIELPTDPDEMMHVLLKLREELIAAKVAKEQMEESLRSEILFMKDRVTAEQHTKNKIEDTLTQEIDALRARVGILSSIELQLEKEEMRRKEAEQQVKEGSQTQASSKQIISSMQKQIEELNACKVHLEQEVCQLKCKIQALQMDLDNSEAVQRDFVKLSQSLQVQLEKIRESENEVRWQYEDDVEECGNCKQGFVGANKKKHHCHHCGKIFCAECSSKTVPSGSKQRPSRVCDVCHTLLVRNTAPYFSKEPPQTPD